MTDNVEVSWLNNESTLKSALQEVFGASGQLVKKHFSSKEQERSIAAKTVTKLPLNFVNHLKINPIYEGPEVKIISESEDFIVLHKPPNVHCHPHAYQDRDTLLNFLVTQKKWDCLEVNCDHYDRGLLYRLDFETSGVIILAKNQKFFHLMRESFNTSMKRKFYWAIVEGDFNQEGTWVHYFRPSGQKGSKQKVTNTPLEGATVGRLTVKKVFSKEGKSLLLVNLKTGLRHQIRAQLSHLGFPILGDELYGGHPNRRIFLHALRYEFTEVVEDQDAELFNIFFDLDSALKVGHDMLGSF
jgi:23S rRNA pseudouridine1911/1915/1917 synthase